MDLAATRHAASDDFHSDDIDCTHPVIPSRGSDDKCAKDSALPRDDNVFTREIEDSCDQALGGYKTVSR